MAQHGGWIDVHGAGAQRSDPKTGNPANYPYGHGPQGDAVRIYNYVRCVRNASATVPVEFFGFDANQQDDTVVVRWSTGSESNNLGFNIERSSDQKTFIAIGFVRGQGTTNVTAEYEFTDEKIPAGYLYYRIKQIDYDGTATYSPVLEVVVSEPKKYHLEQNYPNPFNPSTTISFTLPNTEQATLKIYNLLGEEVVILINEYLPSGRHSIPWNAENLESGIYFYQLVCGEFAEKKKMMLLIQ
jgi:hypothetical protein